MKNQLLFEEGTRRPIVCWEGWFWGGGEGGEMMMIRRRRKRRVENLLSTYSSIIYRYSCVLGTDLTSSYTTWSLLFPLSFVRSLFFLFFFSPASTQQNVLSSSLSPLHFLSLSTYTYACTHTHHAALAFLLFPIKQRTYFSSIALLSLQNKTISHDPSSFSPPTSTTSKERRVDSLSFPFVPVPLPCLCSLADRPSQGKGSFFLFFFPVPSRPRHYSTLTPREHGYSFISLPILLLPSPKTRSPSPTPRQN